MTGMTEYAPIERTDIEVARRRIADDVIETPLIWSPMLSDEAGTAVYLKCENLQVTGSFKARGATNFVRAMMDTGTTTAGVVTASSGNHGQAVAYAAKRAGLPCTVVVPEDVVAVKERAIRSYGADVEYRGKTSSERIARAEEIAAERGWTFVPPYDHPWVAGGQGTAGLEICKQCPDVRQVFVPVGGGGLISGVATAVSSACPEAIVIGVEPAIANDTWLSVRAGYAVEIGSTTTVADGLRTSHPGLYTFPIVQKRVHHIDLVPEEAILAAVRRLLAAKLVTEPSGAVSVAAMLQAAREGTLQGPVVCVLSGGNVASEQLVEALQHG